MEIEHALPTDCGAYKLVISNPNGENVAMCAVAVRRKCTIHIEMLGNILVKHTCSCDLLAEPKKPSFIKPLNDIKVTVGQPINLEAQISGFPSPEIKWLKDGTPLRPSQALNIVNQPGGLIGLK